MNPDDLKTLLANVASGDLGVHDAIRRLRELPFEDLGYARVDHHRSLRRGFPEVVFGEGKTVEQCAEIVGRLAKTGQPAMVTRASKEQFESVSKQFPAAIWHEQARMITLNANLPSEPETARAGGSSTEEILVVTAGTSDIPVAEEAVLTAQMLGASVGRLYDVGVAGIHRLLEARARLDTAKVIVVVAGMEGALPGVVAGLVSAPVIGVPTSVGYGAALGGLAALFSMLTSCSGGLTVVNIDNGFGAGLAAAQIAKAGRA